MEKAMILESFTLRFPKGITAKQPRCRSTKTAGFAFRLPLKQAHVAKRIARILPEYRIWPDGYMRTARCKNAERLIVLFDRRRQIARSPVNRAWQSEWRNMLRTISMSASISKGPTISHSSALSDAYSQMG